MHTAIGRSGRRGLRPVCQRIATSSCPSFTRGFRPPPSQPLDLPALDMKWQEKWQIGRLESKLKGLQAELVNLRAGNHESPVTSSKDKKYVLPMFPYPSGNLHLGHLRVYTISDVLARFHRMQGHEVLHPIGWDAFGLPAENAAIERGVEPATWTKQNIQNMKLQLETMNGEWDWDKEFATCDPTFYKHTQTLFSELYNAGLAYQAESLVNYDPVDKTVLANEQVDSNGCSWRSGAKVEKKMLKQWFFKISEYRQELLDGLKELEKDGAWPERVLSMQKNWLGKSTGARIKFSVVAYDEQTHPDIEVFTTRPDTLFGVQYLALASTHPIVQGLAETDTELQAFLDAIPQLPQDSKAGYLLNVRATNPLAYEESTPDATKASLPIYVAPYVLGDYGDGAVMGVPAHDTRDHTFWKYNRPEDPVRLVVSQLSNKMSLPETTPFIHHGHLTKHSGPYAGLSTAAATKKIVSLLESKGLGEEAETWRLRDWLVSRQRYWGTPIPIIHCTSCGPVLVPEDQLPVELPPVESHWAKGKAGNPLEHAHEWINTPCPKCGEAAKRDTDTMDTFVDSSWYFMRFPDSKNHDLPFDLNAAERFLPVDLYIGGVEHAILHLLYSRFIYKFFTTTKFWPSEALKLGEPFKKVLTQGMVHGKTYSDPGTGRFLKPEEVDLSEPSKPMVIATNQKANISFEKMSKSKYNGVDPGICMAEYGADATRAHILFQAPVSEVLEWDEEKISGVTRWLRRLHDMILKNRWNERETALFDLCDQYTPMQLFMMYEGDVGFDAEMEESTNKLLHDTDHQLNEKLKNRSRLERERLEQNKKFWRSVQATITSVTDSYSQTHSLNTVVSDLMALTNTIVEYTALDTTLGNNNKDNEMIRASSYFALQATRILVQMMAPITPAFAEECWEMIHSTQPRPPPPPPTPIIPKPEHRLPSLQQHIDTSKYLIPILFSVPSSLVKPLAWQWISAYYKKASTHFNAGYEQFVAEREAAENHKASLSTQSSIFDMPFPIPDGTYALLAPNTQTCVVQINGKMRCAVTIPIPDPSLQGEQLEEWLKGEILKTEEGDKLVGKSGKLHEKAGGDMRKAGERKGGKEIDIRKARKVIVVKGGKTVNFVV
ncbi:hypothetical protein VTL71DRAFT_15728 [Oculimacula yallundae]|uniref:leucine--tRNA ligase n=1 Tax=Oculimacula yallundae TaxID=86028 RepID=A0ABR4CD96_9HELO